MNHYIRRELHSELLSYMSGDRPKGLILTGIVGCGKTTLIGQVLKDLALEFEIFKFTGDDARFRLQIIEDTRFLVSYVKRKTTRRSLIFVDEVQKVEEVFDALKIAFDEGNCSFIVSGSNPAYLSTVAKRRLQRRADQLLMLPLSLSELVVDRGLAPAHLASEFRTVLWETRRLTELRIPELSWSEQVSAMSEEFFVYGGLPLVINAKSNIEKLREIRLTVERGFDLISNDNNSIADIVRRELALLQSQEFGYKHILEKTRQRQRDVINSCIDQLINHGYLTKRKLFYFEQQKISYLTIFSFTDPGVVSYLSGNHDYELVKGFQTEGYIHSRLQYFVQNDPRLAQLYYYKEYDKDSRGNLKYLKADVDFVLTQGTRVVPIECKAGLHVRTNELDAIQNFIAQSGAPFGVVLYQGVPQIDPKRKLLFWPYWLV